jgi:Flp pilus assembly pilin Flp
MRKMQLKLGALRNASGQNFIEYALVAGFLAASACAILPDVVLSVSTVFSQVGTVAAGAASQGVTTLNQSEALPSSRN